jgi:glycerol uptake facilitator protein
MNYRAYAAEFLGAMTLTMSVMVASAFNTSLPTPVIAGVTLGLFVYTIGGVSGAHLNPAVTIGLLSVDKIKPKNALFYIVAQFLGATVGMLLLRSLIGDIVRMSATMNVLDGIGEAIGAFFLTFGVAAAAHKKLDIAIAGVVVGTSLMLGAYLVSSAGWSKGVLNPAVSWGLGTFNVMYVLGPIIGAVAGAWAFKLLHDE